MIIHNLCKCWIIVELCCFISRRLDEVETAIKHNRTFMHHFPELFTETRCIFTWKEADKLWSCSAV